ncbi:hypothetical protein Micbo1qcDRAFT_218873 [Microdochium bolleyi]|uniref:Uncharacterized protein n=1 Tax=Microdochium bolleyi TaxID=196109 RepID=A0A136IP54_9PEZI|nr:hypothetical protein Micbo1qcDRAFT_218873 [Microdochium bolleyi]
MYTNWQMFYFVGDYICIGTKSWKPLVKAPEPHICNEPLLSPLEIERIPPYQISPGPTIETVKAMDSPAEFVEIKVTARGHHKNGIARRVDRARAEASIIIGKDLDGVHPVFIQAASGSNVVVPISNSLARGARVRATGYKNNISLQAIPFVAFCRPGAIEAAKHHINGNNAQLDFSDAEWPREAERRMKKWKEGGPWAPPDQLAYFCEPLPPISLDAISWGVDEPYDRIPAFGNYQLGENFEDLIIQLRAKMSFDYMTTSQLTVYTLWWCHYMERNEKKHEQHADDSYDVAAAVPLIIFAILMPVVLREAEEDGLAFFPNLMRAAVARAQVEFPSSTQEWERLETESKLLQDEIEAIFADTEPTVIATLLPGDLIGTRNEGFSETQLRKSTWANPDAHAMTHADAVKPTVDLLGDINTIYMPHPRVQNPRLEYRMLIPAASCQVSYKKMHRARHDLPSLENLNDKKVQRSNYTHIALPSSASTRTDYSALANKPHHIIVNITDSSTYPLSQAPAKNKSRLPGITKTEDLSTVSSLQVKREPLSQNMNMTTVGELKTRARPGPSNARDLQPLKRQCLPPDAPSSLHKPKAVNDTNKPQLVQRQQPLSADRGPGQQQASPPVNEVSSTSRQCRADGTAADHIHIDQVLPEARKRGWISPSDITDAARAKGLIDPTNEVDKGKLALLGFEKPALRAAPAPLVFRKDERQTPPHLLERGAQGGRPLCTELAHRPSDGAVATTRVTLLAFSPLTSKLAQTLRSLLNDSSAASDIVALREFEDGISDLLTICNRIALISSAVVDARARQPGDPRRQIAASLTSGLVHILEEHFGDSLPPEFYARLSACRWTWGGGLDDDLADDPSACTMADFLRWARDLHKFWYVSAIAIERCCAAVKLGCHETFLPRTRLRLWKDWVRPWQQHGTSDAIGTDGPWRLQRKHERLLREQQQPSLRASAAALPPALEPATCLSLQTVGHELQCEIYATALSDMHGDEDIATWLFTPCDVGRSVDCSVARGLAEDDGLYLHRGRYWCL